MKFTENETLEMKRNGFVKRKHDGENGAFTYEVIYSDRTIHAESFSSEGNKIRDYWKRPDGTYSVEIFNNGKLIYKEYTLSNGKLYKYNF